MISSRPAADVIVVVAPVIEVPPSSDGRQRGVAPSRLRGPLSPPPPHAAAMTVAMASTG